MSELSRKSVNNNSVNFNEDYARVSLRFKDFLRARGYSAKSLAQILDISPRTAQGHLDENKGMPEGEMLFKYLHAFGSPLFIVLFEPMGLIKCPRRIAADILRETADEMEG